MYVYCINCNNLFRKREDNTILTCEHCEPLYQEDISYNPKDDSSDEPFYMDSEDWIYDDYQGDR